MGMESLSQESRPPPSRGGGGRGRSPTFHTAARAPRALAAGTIH